MNRVARLDADLLLDLLDSPDLILSSHTLLDLGAAAAGLLDAGLLVPDGHESSVVAFDGTEMASAKVAPHPETGGLGWFDRDNIWHPVTGTQLQRYRLDIGAIFQHLIGNSIRIAKPAPRPHCDGLVWEVGRVHIAGSHWCDLLFVRRLQDPASRDSALLTLAKLRSAQSQLVLAPSCWEHDKPAAIIDIHKLIGLDGSGRIDHGRLVANFEGRDLTITDRVNVSPDGRRLTVDGEVMAFSGDIVIGLVQQLFETWKTGVPRRAAEMLDRAGSSAHSLDKAFGARWPELRRYLTNTKGHWKLDPDAQSRPEP
ncbi:MAG: hypothetical protein KDK08_26690 [Rhizobiaceae bacterium]|nr:hypothetical protein [Rhizobiaceae bacterium]